MTGALAQLRAALVVVVRVQHRQTRSTELRNAAACTRPPAGIPQGVEVDARGSGNQNAVQLAPEPELQVIGTLDHLHVEAFVSRPGIERLEDRLHAAPKR